MDTQDTEQKSYELAFLARDEKAPAAVAAIVKAAGGEVTLEGPVEKLELAYKIGRETSAFFGYDHFTAPGSAIAEIEKELKASPTIIRTLIVTPPFVKSQSRWEGRAKHAPNAAPVPTTGEYKPENLPLSNEALEKKIEEILK